MTQRPVAVGCPEVPGEGHIKEAQGHALRLQVTKVHTPQQPVPAILLENLTENETFSEIK